MAEVREGYINGSVVPLSDDDDDDKWFQLDALLQGWILSTITDEVSDLVIYSVSTPSALWKVIHNLFHDKKHAQAMQLEHEFRTTIKGNSTMEAYCQQLQNLADCLDDVDAPVSQHQLVLQLLRGLPADLQDQTSFMQFKDSMPMFMQTQFTHDKLERARMVSCRPISTPMDAKAKLSSSSGTALRDPSLYSALYQLHLVKSSTARALIPNEFRLVEAFGYTLGGFFLASYDDSPVGTFDELVVIAGIVWNPPISCAYVFKPLTL
ncbi:unnamed protein product [Cuscuta campestris]|uniref:Retrotransposon gag domain-containing protein n=1 Tax=Cuscuta campestris TaxID=132261 RepID=A0A484LK32_9ASTE|nr:unnamed protein product [Cuscuta campestris]